MIDSNFRGITIQFKEHWACITTDQALMDYLKEPGNGSIPLAEYIRKRYRELFHKELEISTYSLSIEILIHAYLDLLSKKSMSVRKILPENLSKPILYLVEELHEKTEVIDCGEKSVDYNRLAFDSLAPFHAVIYSALGSLA